MKKLLEYLLVCTLLCAAIAGPSTVFADVCKVYGSQHQYTEEGYEALHPHKEYVACKCGFADYTGGTRTLDDCTECSEDSGPAHTPDDPEDETCAHTTKIKINTQIVDYQQTDVINASTHHAIIHTYSWQCTDCQKTFDPITELMCYAAHNFNSQGVCKECNYCTHTNIRKEYLDGGKVVNKDDYYHHYIENPYKGSCDYCGTVITGVDEEPELHEYDRDGWCFCGYYNEDYCPHDHTKLRDAGYGYGVDGLITETRHFTEHCYEEYCFDCDTIIGNGWADSGPHNPWWEGYWEDHDFGSDGYCVCGYYKEPEVCAHENSELRLTDTTYSMDEIDAEMHWVQYDYDVYCFDCKQVVSTTWEGQGEYHVFNENGYCSACGFQKGPAEITETLVVSLSSWYKTAAVNTSIGVTANVSGGSGDFTYYWAASSDKGKYVQTSSSKSSWAITPTTADTWRFTLVLQDNVTGENVTVHSGKTVVQVDEDRYRLSLPASEYCISNMRLVNTGTLIQVQVLDTVDGTIHNINEIPGISLYFNTDNRINTLTNSDLLLIKEGNAELKLIYFGEEVDSARWFVPQLSVKETGMSEGSASGTNFLRLEDMQLVDWDASGMYLSEDLMMFDFEAKPIGTGGYVICFDVRNASPSTYAIASYYPDGTLCDKQFIDSYWGEFWLGDVGIGGGQAIAEGFDRKWGNSGLHTQKTTIELVVPEGGYYTFLESHEDEDVMCRNAAEYALGMLGTELDILDLLLLGDKDAVDSARKALKDRDNAEVFYSTCEKALKENITNAKEVLDSFKDVSTFVYDLLKNEAVLDALLKSLGEITVGASIKNSVEAVSAMIDKKLPIITKGIDAILGVAELAHLFNHIQQNERGESQIFFECVVMPSY